MSLENKAEKRSVYVDARDSKELEQGKGWSTLFLFLGGGVGDFGRK